MSACCVAPGAGDVDGRCPRCRLPGAVVGAAPVCAHHADAVDGPWRYCSNAACPVVFFLDEAVVDQDVVVTQVGLKAVDKPTPMCFCFAHTLDDIGADLLAHDGQSTIKAVVKAAVADGFCACEHLNPTGECCLADIHRAVKQLQVERPCERVADDALQLIERS